MPPKSRSGWKTGEQLEFLISNWPTFRRAQDTKALDQFWDRIFDQWHTRWPPVPSAALSKTHGSPEAARLMLQKDKNTQIKHWFNNRCRGIDSAKMGRGDLKLDVNEKRKLAPLQAYCSYAWGTLRPVVLTRWQQQKVSATFDDDDDPSEDVDGTSAEACIPLSFKLKIAKEIFDELSPAQKAEIDARRDEDRKKLYLSIPELEDEEDRTAKLQIHQRNQPLVAKSLFRVLKNLEDQTGCIAQLFIGSVRPEDGHLDIRKFCQGKTEQGLNFQTFYGKDWIDNTEKKFAEWAVRVFGDEGSSRREMFVIPAGPSSKLKASSEMPGCEASSSRVPSSEALSSTQPSSHQHSSTLTVPSEKSVSRPVASRKGKSRSAVPQMPEESPLQPSAPGESASREVVLGEPAHQPTATRAPLPTRASTQTASVPELPQNISTSTPTPLALGGAIDPPPSVGALGTNDNDMNLLSTVLGVHQLLSQVAAASQVPRVPSVTTSDIPGVVRPSQLINPPQVAVSPSQPLPASSQTPAEAVVMQPGPIVTPITPQLTAEIPEVVEPSQLMNPSQPLPASSQVPTEVVVTQPGAVVTPVPQLTTKISNVAAADPGPKAQYRVRNPATTVSGVPSRRGSIDGAPEMDVDLHANPKIPSHQDFINDEIIVDLRDHISVLSDTDDETHISSSQKSSDGCQDLLPPPSSQSRRSGPRKGEGVRTQPKPTSTHARLDVDDEDLPTWMVKREQWKYIASTAGGPTWENLLKVYMQQERRLEFTDRGATLTHEDRPSKIKEYFQYAHQPTRGDTLAVPDFGAEVVEWWKRLQPDWRRAGQDAPQSLTTWSYILSGGSKGAFLLVMCLAWWDRAHARYLEEEKNARRIEAEATGVTANFDNLPDHDVEWLKTVNDVTFVMERAQHCDIPTRGMLSPSRKAKRKRETEPATPQKKRETELVTPWKKPVVKASSLKTRSRA